ncbi:MAG: hypothetical protein HZC01_00065 [Candidatus Kerfeldbacteria bacterium]|nr:hypothetical protein [Candidatus Kerfeldbacteria bacterium]
MIIMQTTIPLVKFRFLIIGMTLLGGVIALLFALTAAVQFDTSISFSINRTNTLETQQYQYDGYYAIQASDLFSQTVMSWFLTPSVLLEIYDSAEIDPNISSIEELTSRFKTRKYSPQNIVVRYQERDRPTADRIAQAITAVVEQRAAEANKTIEQEALFEVKGGTPVIVEKKPSAIINTIIGLVAGFVLSVVTVYSFEYIRRPGAVPTQS